MIQTEWKAGWNYHTNDNGNGDISWGWTRFQINNGQWTIQNGKYPDNGYLGPWTPGDFSETALNKAGNDIGYFDVYSILRGEYVKRFEPIAQASDDNPIDITYVLENPGAERFSTIGWKYTGDDWASQPNASLNGKVSARYFERWKSSNLGNADLYQTISGLPDGFYRFSAIAHGDEMLLQRTFPVG